MNIILFGPPGIGKSTIIGKLKTLGERALDLEDIYPSKVRFQLPNQIDNVIIGAADLDPKRKYTNALKVLLFMPQPAYDKRRERRDSLIPGKANQDKHKVSDWRKGIQYDLVLDVNRDLHSVISQLRDFVERSRNNAEV